MKVCLHQLAAYCNVLPLRKVIPSERRCDVGNPEMKQEKKKKYVIERERLRFVIQFFAQVIT